MTSPRRTVENWSELNRDLLSEIADRINCLRDFIIFGAVCRSWRSVASPEKFNKSTKVPWLLLDKDDDYHSPRKFFNLSKDLIYRINLPKSRNSPCHFGNFSMRNGYIYSSKGWLLNVENHVELCLWNPFSLSRITLPHSFILCSNYILLLNFALSSSPSLASDFVILIVFYSFVTRDVKLGFWKNGDHDWIDIDLIFSTFDSNITYRNGRFYIVGRFEFGAEFVVHEIDIQNSESVSISSKSFANLFPSTHIDNPSWIVGSSRGLMIVTWRLDNVSIDEDGNIVGDLYSHVPHFEFIVQEIDFEKGECNKVSDLGDEAFFLGCYSLFLVDVSNESRFKSNHIYFAENCQQTFSCGSGGSVGVYSMIDGSYEPFFTEADFGYRCSSQWIEPRP